MKLAMMLMLVLISAGCSTQEPEHGASTTEVSVAAVGSKEISQSINYGLADSLETQLILSFWLHLDKERTKLDKMLQESLSERDRKTIQKFMQMVQEQQQGTWQTLFEPEPK